MGVVFKSVQPAELALTANEQPAGVWIDAVFREHYHRVVALLVRLTADRAQAEELASDVFCKLARHRGVEAEALLPWIYRVATNAGLDALRVNARRRRREEVAGAEGIRLGGQKSALDGMLRQERCAQVRAVLGTLKPRDAELLLLRAEGMAYRELAEALGVQPGSVGTLLARAEAEFERRFRARYGDDV
jgi:RNA polymerase sigma-70 factor (ECF subfamily)